MKRPIILTLAAVGLAAVGYVTLAPGTAQTSRMVLSPDDPAVLTLGAEIYDANCASCHGANLEGQPNWRMRGPDGRLPAPPHDETGHTWHHDGDTLFKLTKYGAGALIGDPDYESNMPIYEDVLSDDEIIAVLSYIKSTWPAEIRAMHDEMEDRP